MPKIFTDCSRCGKPIYYGNAYVTILRNIEQADLDVISNREEITIIDSSEVITFCGSCGNAFDASLIANIINAIPPDSNRIADN